MVTHKFKFGTVETGYLLVASARYSETTTTVSKMNFVLQSSLTTFLLGDIVEFYDSTTTLKFKGEITRAEVASSVWTIEVKDLGNILTNTRFTTVYRNKSPEFIIEDIITNYTTLTYSSTISTGEILPKQTFRDDILLDGITKMMETFNGTFSVSKTGIFTLIQKQNSINTNQINSTNGDILQGKWKNDANKKYTKIIVEGANIDQQNEETFIGSQSQVTLAKPPKNIKVTNSSGTVLTQTTSSISGDYTVDIQAMTIDFSPNQTDPKVEYTYQSQVRVEIGTGKTLKLQKSYLEDKDEALNLALSALQLYQDGIQTSKWLKNDGTDFEDYIVGETIIVTDNTNNVSGDYEITRVDYEYPNRLYLTVGEDEEGIFDWQKEAQQRIQELEQKEQASDFVTNFIYTVDNLNIALSTDIITYQKKAIDNGFVLDSSVLDGTDILDGSDDQSWIPIEGSKFPMSFPWGFS